MQDAPKIVTDRLRAAVPVVNHPDADVLSAFSEAALSERERAVVLEHLARCGDCREVVALALPEAEPLRPLVRPSPRGWLTWPVLRWGFVAVGVVAIASVGLVQYRRHSGHPSAASVAQLEPVKKEAQNVPPPSPVSPETSQDKVRVPAGSGSDARNDNASKQFDRVERYDRRQAGETLDNKAREKKSLGRVLDGVLNAPAQLTHGPKVQYQNNFQSTLQNRVARERAPVVPLPKPLPNTFMPVDTNAPPASLTAAQGQPTPADVRGKDQEALVLQNTMALRPMEGGQGQIVERAKDVDGLAMSRSTKIAGAMASPPAAAFALAPPNASWTISSGTLQRSLDQGKTWQDVNVNVPPPPAANYAFISERAEEKAADDKHGVGARFAATPPVFRAVVANGADVWAGGSGGSLYHSIDSGAHWMRVVPSSGTRVLTGDIVSLDFPDARHGKIMTSTPELWLTPDGGQTWQKQ